MNKLSTTISTENVSNANNNYPGASRRTYLNICREEEESFLIVKAASLYTAAGKCCL